MKIKLLVLFCLAIVITAVLIPYHVKAAPTPWPQPPYPPTVINFSTSGDTVVYTGAAGTGVCVYGLFFTTGGSTNITIKDGTTAQTGPMSFATNGAGFWQMSSNPKSPWFLTSAGNNFVINSSNAVQVSGAVYAQPCP